EADQKNRHGAALEALDQGGTPGSRGLAGQYLMRDVALFQRRFDQAQHLGELREQQDAPALADQTLDQLQQGIELDRGLDLFRAGQLDQAWIAAGLAQFQQGIEHDDADLRQATLLDGLA